MTVSNRTTLKAFFETGDYPTQSNFSDFIDSCANLAEVSAQVFQSSIGVSATVSAILGEFTTVSATTANLTTVNANRVSAATGVFTTVSATTISPVNITGTNTNNNAAAGSVGEIIEALGTAVSLTSVTNANLTSISLTAGDWDVWGNVQFTPAAGTTMAELAAAISSTSATFPVFGAGYTDFILPFTASSQQRFPVSMKRVSLASTTTIYLVGFANFSVSTLQATGYIGARRVR